MKLSKPWLAKAKRYGSLTENDKRELLEHTYVEQGWSWAAIADVCSTYPNKVRREALSLGIKSRTRSESQKLALASGRHAHPTKGKQHSQESKDKISNSMAESWENMSPKELRRRQEMARKQWDAMSDKEKAELQRKASEAIRETIHKGSKLENHLREGLAANGYQVNFHVDYMVKNQNLQIDLHIPNMNVAIEVDGPSHFTPIWGEDALRLSQQADAEKDGLLLGMGLCVIRVQQTKEISEKFKRDTLSRLLEVLQKIEKKFPAREKRHIVLGD